MSGNRASGVTPRPSWSVAARITIWYTAAAALLLVGVAVTLNWVLQSTSNLQVTELAEHEVEEVIEALRQPDGDSKQVAEEILRETTTSSGVRFWIRVLDEHGRSLLETPGMQELGLTQAAFPKARHLDHLGPGRQIQLTSGGHALAFTAGVDADATTGATRVVQIAIDRTAIERILAHYRDRLGIVIAVAFTVLSVMGYALARRGLRPLRGIVDTMNRIRSATSYQRVEPEGLPAELSGLAVAFNDVLERLDQSYVRVAQFSADIAHELRTPLNRIRLNVEVTLQQSRSPEEYREVLASSLEDVVKLSQLIDRLLFLARAEDSDHHMHGEDVDVSAEIRALTEFYEPAANESRIDLRTRVPSHLRARVDRDLFQRAVGNLIENAIAYTRPSGKITIAAHRATDRFIISVTDTGDGIPAEHLPRLFDALNRVDRARSSASGGAGLGLAIVQKIVRLHGGSVDVASEMGVGTTVTMSFPQPAMQGASASAHVAS